MRWKRGDSERGYHHGNLKEALVRAALDLIAREGSGRLHLCRCRALGGRQSGRALSPLSRPRRPAFRCRAARLRANSSSGFRSLGRRQARSAGGVRTARQGLSRFRAQRAGLLFGDVRGRHSARRQPGTCAPPAIAPSRWCAKPARRSRRCCRSDKRPPALMMALHIWALSHGIASLFARGDGGTKIAADVGRRTCWKRGCLSI